MYCGPLVDDDVGGLIREGHLDQLRKMGEIGRVALLRIAKSDAGAKRCALGYLVDLRDSRAIPFLRALAEYPETSVDLSLALYGLGRLQDRSSYDLIARAIDLSKDGPIERAIDALGVLDDDRARVKLRGLLTDPRFALYSGRIMRALGRQRDTAGIDSISRLATTAAGEKNWWRLADAIVALASIRTPESLRLAQLHFRELADERWQTSAMEEARSELRAQLRETQDPTSREAISAALARIDGWRSR